LWSLLRNKQVKGLKFRRQHTIGSYTIDFYCEAAKLVVELDGDAHNNVGSNRYDFERDEWLKLEGYNVLRFKNEEVLKHPESVVWAIEDAIDGQVSEG